MGVFGSRIEEDKALLLCHERKKFVKQALNGRCALASAHVTYIHSLKSTGTALRKFVQPEAPVESSGFTSTIATPEPPCALTEKSASQFSVSSPSPSPLSSTGFQAKHMRFIASASTKVEESLPIPVIGTVVSSRKLEHVPPISSERLGTSSFDGPAFQHGTPPWDFFSLFHPVDHQFSSQEENDMNQTFERSTDREGIPDLEDAEERESFLEEEESEESDDEFDEPSPDKLIRSFENVHRGTDHDAVDILPALPSTESVASETELFDRAKSNSPGLSSFGGTSTGISRPADTSKAHFKESCIESKITPKDLFSSMKEIESLFIKASESGKEVPRMLEANKLNFRPILPGERKKGSMVSSAFWKACFSCGEEPKPPPEEEPAQTAIKYLTWHRTVSSHSSSSRNLLGDFSKDEIDDPSGNLNSCMISGSHASTLDRLHAWERKLYDEVKASEMVRREYDLKCEVLRQLESKVVTSHKIDKTRAVVKDLHSRIRVAIHRINSISRTIEDLRDKELQPQLEELIAGLSRMWEVMSECHKLQFQIITIADINRDSKFSGESEARRQITIHLENELYSLSSSFQKWIGAQKLYLEAIDGWLLKCVSLPQKNLKRNRRMPPPSVRNYGPPPIYVCCNVWLENLKALPEKEVADSVKNLAAETSRFLPRQEKRQAKGGDRSEAFANHSAEDLVPSFNGFHSSLIAFLCQLNRFAESSSGMYKKLDKAIEDCKRMYYQHRSHAH